MKYQVYVRGHGGEEEHMLPPTGDIAISMITVGQFGSTMSDQVADESIFRHRNYDDWVNLADEEKIIYWTRSQRDEYYNTGRLEFSKPSVAITNYNSISHNLALDGAADIEGKCGVCYWDSAQGTLVWLLELSDGETVLLSKVLEMLAGMIAGTDNEVELYWTACMKARYWSGTNKKVSKNPEADRGK